MLRWGFRKAVKLQNDFFRFKKNCPDQLYQIISLYLFYPVLRE